jgi:hypothetical protein
VTPSIVFEAAAAAAAAAKIILLAYCSDLKLIDHLCAAVNFKLCSSTWTIFHRLQIIKQLSA